MKKIVISFAAALALATPFAASAHQMAVYKIGGASYQFVIGSLGEPIAVDDKTGLDLTINKCSTSACSPTMGNDGDMDGPAGTGVTGLEDTLKLELIAGDQKKTLPISPLMGRGGSYTAPFYFTVPTTVSYRIFGSVSGSPVDLTFTCVPPGSSHALEDMVGEKISDSVTQISKSGGFGCPSPKADLGFPESSASIVGLSSDIQGARSTSDWAIGLGILGLVVAGASIMRKK